MLDEMRGFMEFMDGKGDGNGMENEVGDDGG